MKHVFTIVLLLAFCAGRQQLFAQTYSPVPITGFNNDVVAESGTNATAVTTTELDLSFYLLYSEAFAVTNGLSGGMVDNGTVVNANRTYQLAPYNANNGLYLSNNGTIVHTAASGTLALSTPAAYGKLSLLLFSTEGNSTIGFTLHFADGTSAPGGSVTVLDWFNGANAVYSGVGRIARNTAPPYLVDGLSGNNPRFYRYDISMACRDQPKPLDSISIRYMSGSGASSRAVILALSGIVYTPVTVTASVRAATCDNADGSIALTANGGTAPLSYTWTSTPVQLQDSASHLKAGNYSCTILDANGCATTYNGVVPKKTAAVLTATADKDPICTGSSATLHVSADGPVTNYSWQPGNGSGNSFTVTPAATTSYIVSATDTLGCEVRDTVQVRVTAVPPMPAADAVTACADSTATLKVQKPGILETYRWYAAASGGDPLANGVSYTVPASATGATYYLEAANGICNSSRVPVTVTRLGEVAKPLVTATQVMPNSVTFVWQPVPDATGYRVSVNGGPFAAPSSGAMGTTHLVSGLPLSQGVSIRVVALGGQTCQNSDPGDASAKLLSQDLFIPNAFTPNNDGLNDQFKAEGNIISGQSMKIFNQWGELIFETSATGEGWDGTHKGKAQPVGVYIYAIRLKLADGTEVLKKGSINLIR
ncbi:MAG TPA: gliding motility-associated C-terminal domain-containing protein [Chitinophaga sp.]